MSNQTIIPPELDDVLQELKNSIFANLNCIQIGKIETVNLEEQTAEIQIQIKRRKSDNTIIDYPLLVDCPIIILQGGGAYLEFPVSSGDYCLVLFNDRNIDKWWSTANVVEPDTKRKHSLSDGFALVGINPKTSVLDLSGDVVKINAPNYPVQVFGETIELNGDSKTFVTHAELNTAIQTFIEALNLHVHTSAASGSPTTAPVTSLSLDISSATTTTIKTGG